MTAARTSSAPSSRRLPALTEHGTTDWSVWIATPLIVGLPLADTAIAILRRSLARRPLFLGDRSHVYDQLVDRGWRVETSTAVCVLLQGALAALGVLAAGLDVDWALGDHRGRPSPGCSCWRRPAGSSAAPPPDPPQSVVARVAPAVRTAPQLPEAVRSRRGTRGRRASCGAGAAGVPGSRGTRRRRARRRTRGSMSIERGRRGLHPPGDPGRVHHDHAAARRRRPRAGAGSGSEEGASGPRAPERAPARAARRGGARTPPTAPTIAPARPIPSIGTIQSRIPTAAYAPPEPSDAAA